MHEPEGILVLDRTRCWAQNPWVAPAELTDTLTPEEFIDVLVMSNAYSHAYELMLKEINIVYYSKECVELFSFMLHVTYNPLYILNKI